MYIFSAAECGILLGVGGAYSWLPRATVIFESTTPEVIILVLLQANLDKTV